MEQPFCVCQTLCTRLIRGQICKSGIPVTIRLMQLKLFISTILKRVLLASHLLWDPRRHIFREEWMITYPTITVIPQYDVVSVDPTACPPSLLFGVGRWHGLWIGGSLWLLYPVCSCTGARATPMDPGIQKIPISHAWVACTPTVRSTLTTSSRTTVTVG